VKRSSSRTPVVMGPAPREIVIANRHPRLRFNQRVIARVIATLEAHHTDISPQMARIPPGEISLVFLTDSALAAVHEEFLDDPSTTDVITFEGNPALGTAGEICVSADMAAAYSRRHRRDFSAELTLYLVHGWLHLAGYDDLKPLRKRAMRRAESRAMRALARAGALPKFTLSRRR